MKKKLLWPVYGLVVVLVAGFAVANAGSSGTGGTVRSKLTLMAPAAPGGGWDGFARESQQALRANGIVNNAQVVNVPGAGGTIGLSQLTQMTGREDILMATGAAMVGGIAVGRTSDTLDDTTLIARLADDYNVVVVPTDSPFETFDDFVEGWRESPGSTVLAGGSLGSIDHLLSGMLAIEAGIDPRAINYVAYAGGGEVLTSLLSNTATAGISSFNDFRDQIEGGNLRALAVSAAEPIEGTDIPTFRESGFDVEMSNWRGFVAPAGISEEARRELVDIVTELVATDEWATALSRNRWADTFQTGSDYSSFIDEQVAATDTLVKELGL